MASSAPASGSAGDARSDAAPPGTATKKPVLTALEIAMAALATAEQEEKIFCDDVASDDRDILGYRNPVVADGDIIALYDIKRGLYWECRPTIGRDSAVKLLAREGHELHKGHQFRVVMAPTLALDKADECAAATGHFFSTGKEARHRFALESLLNEKIIAPNFRRRIHVNVALGDGRKREKALFKSTNLFSFQHTSRKWLEGTEIMKERLPVVRIMHNGDNQVCPFLQYYMYPLLLCFDVVQESHWQVLPTGFVPSVK